jgi:gliding motility-associated-like protein
LIFLLSFVSSGQSCPPNIDFEKGSFDGWTCYVGRTAAVGSQNVITLNPTGGPAFSSHTMYTNSREVDPYGLFPVRCPNGSGNTIKLGNDRGGAQADGVSYEFTIPANQNSYSLTYHYAVVFQAPNHRDIEQPRMEIEIENLTDNKVIECASFTFISVGTSLPGFMATSGIGDTTTVMYKPWTAVSVDLSGNAGKTIRIFFKTADCTFQRHFGYAYIDVDSECDGSFTGATFCPDDTAINVVAPYGYESYKWYNSSLSTLLGTNQTLTLTPPPASGSTLAVMLQPYPGFGCPQTLYTTVKDSLTVISNAGADAFSCNKDPVEIGARPKAGLSYFWTPADGLSNPYTANPLASPDKTTSYVLATSNSGGGCRTTDTVVVKASKIKGDMTLVGKAAYCFGYGDSSILHVQPTDSIQWYKDNAAISGANKTSLRVNQSGVYYAMLYNDEACIISTSKQPITIDRARAPETYPVQYALINSPFTLKARSFGQDYLWSPGISLNSPSSSTPVFTGSEDQLYTIRIKTNTGCITVDTQLVKSIKQVEVFVPTGFTPNNDGKNDFLRPIMMGVKQLRYFRVFNRWGNMMYDMKGEHRGWDGSSKGIPQQTQTVVWMFEGVGIDNKVYIKKGTSVLLR